jgi:hypothetical protein
MAIMQDRQQHQQEVQAFLQKRFSAQSWELTLPRGTESESYFAHTSRQACFVKLGADAVRYQAMATPGLTPDVLAVGSLGDGTSIIAQPYIAGRTPSRKDYRTHLEQFATAIARYTTARN